MSSRRLLVVFGILSLLLPAGDLWAEGGSVDVAGFEMTSPVRQQLRRLQEAWQRWTGAWYQGDQEGAATILEEILSVSEYVGMERLPDLAAAASGYAIQAALDGDSPKARWALETAEAFDPDLPELHLARAEVARLEGDWMGWVGHRMSAFGALRTSEVHRTIQQANWVLWMLYTLLLSGALFVIVQVAAKGPTLLAMGARLVGDLQGPAGVLVAIGVLLWPLVLPHGVAWMLLYWSVLLWTWCGWSERLVIGLTWLVIGFSPLILASEQQRIQLETSPPARIVESLETRSLYGSMFSDLAVLRTLLPESSAAAEVVADLHRRFGQWEHARAQYQNLLEEAGGDTVQAAAILNNLGVYHFYKEDYGTAIQLLRDSTDMRPTAQAFYNLSQSYSKSYNFEASHEALAEAKSVDSEAVEQWLGTGSADAIPQDVVGIDGGLQKKDRIREELRLAWGADDDLPSVEFWRRHLALSAVILALGLAFALDFARRRWEIEAPDIEAVSLSGWMRTVVPGLPSATEGRGLLAWGALLLPTSLLLLPTMRSVGFRAPLACDPAFTLTLPLCVLALASVVAVRVFLERRA